LHMYPLKKEFFFSFVIQIKYFHVPIYFRPPEKENKDEKKNY